MALFGDEIWSVWVNGVKYKGDLTRARAEAIAERHQNGLLKHRDTRTHVEIRRDKDLIRETDEMYKRAKRGDMQQYQYSHWVED